MTPKVVIDTKVVISALVFDKGHVSWLRAAWAAARCRPLVSAATVRELVRALAYPKFRLSEADRDELLGDYLPFAQTVLVPAGLDLPRCSDPDDEPFLALAYAGKAAMLITGDRALLSLAGECPFEIIRPARARELLDVRVRR